MGANRTADPYAILGIPNSATQAEAHAAWRRLCAIYHPDRYYNADEGVRAEADQRMAAANAAYNTISRSGSQKSAETHPETTPRETAKRDPGPRTAEPSGRSKTRAAVPISPRTATRARWVAATLFVAITLLGGAWGLVIVLIPYSTTVEVPTNVGTLGLPVPWLATIRCESALNARADPQSLVKARVELNKYLDNSSGVRAADSSEHALFNACANSSRQRLRDAGWKLLLGLVVAASVAYNVYKRMRERGRLDIGEWLKRDPTKPRR